MKNFFNSMTSKPWLVLALILIIFTATSTGLQNFKLDASSDALVIQGDEDFKIYRETGEVFGNSDFLIVTFTPNTDLFSPNSLSTIKSLELALEKLPSVESVLSILDAPIFFQPRVPLTDLVDNLKTLETKGIDLIAAKEEISNNPIYSELIISPSGKTTAMQITLSENDIYRELIRQRYQLLEGDILNSQTQAALKETNRKISKINDTESKQRAALIANIRLLLTQHAEAGTLFLGGASMIATDMMSFIKADLAVFGVGVALIFCAMLYLFFQNIWFVLLPLANAFLTTVFTASILGLMDWKISVISSNFIALLLILTISLTVHVLVRFIELSKSNKGFDEVLNSTLDQMVMPCLFAALTTGIAFLSLLLGDIKPVIEFGKMMSVGICFAFIFTFTFLPVAMKLLISINTNETPPWVNSIPSKLADFTLLRGKMIAVFFVGISVLMILGISRLEVENRFIDYFSPDTEIYQGMLLLDQELGGTATLEILIDQPDEILATNDLEVFDDGLFEDDLFADDSSQASGYWWNASSLSKLEAIHDYLDEIPEMGKVLSVASGIKLARIINDDKSLNDLELALLRSVLPENIKETLLYSYINEDDSKVRISARVLESAPSLNRKELLDKINTDLVSKFNLAPDQFKITGLAVLYNNMLQSLFSSQIKSLGLVFGAIGLMLLILFRSFKVMMIALVPNLITAGSVLGMLGLLSIPLDMMTITVAAISVGMAVDNTIHYLFRYRSEVLGNMSADNTVINAHNSVGRAVFYTAATIAAGFSIFIFSNFTPTVLFGVFTAFALIVSFFASLTLLPFLLKQFRAFSITEV